MFKRRSSKDLSAKIGYDHVNHGKANKKVDSNTQPAASVAPVASITLQKSTSNGSGVIPRKATATPSPDQRDAPSSAGPSSAGAELADTMKALPPIAPAPQPKAKPSSSSSARQAPTPPAEPPAKSLVVGEGVVFEGTTKGCDAAIIAGKMEGTVNSLRLEIGKTGRMQGEAVVETAEIAGTFEGKLTVTKALKICSTGRFRGDVSFGSIIVDNGGKIEGKVNFGGMRSAEEESSTHAKDSKPLKTTEPEDSASPVSSAEPVVEIPAEDAAVDAAAAESSSAPMQSPE